MSERERAALLLVRRSLASGRCGLQKRKSPQTISHRPRGDCMTSSPANRVPGTRAPTRTSCFLSLARCSVPCFTYPHRCCYCYTAQCTPSPHTHTCDAGDSRGSLFLARTMLPLPRARMRDSPPAAFITLRLTRALFSFSLLFLALYSVPAYTARSYIYM